MNKDEIGALIRAGYRVGTASLSDLRAAAAHARRSADRMDIDTRDEDHLAADMNIYTSLCTAAEMLDLLATYKQVQMWGSDDPIDLTDNDHTNGEQHP